MRNTDRGADNYMIKHCEAEHDNTLVDVAPSRFTQSSMPQMSELRRDGLAPTQPPVAGLPSSPSVSRASSGQPPYTRKPHIHIAAIDNSLSFPHEHPKGWRSYTYGVSYLQCCIRFPCLKSLLQWLYLPVSVIGTPFSQKTRDHFLPLLTSKQWWEETTFQLRKMFAVDPGFHPTMFAVSLLASYQSSVILP